MERPQCPDPSSRHAFGRTAVRVTSSVPRSTFNGSGAPIVDCVSTRWMASTLVASCSPARMMMSPSARPAACAGPSRFHRDGPARRSPGQAGSSAPPAAREAPSAAEADEAAAEPAVADEVRRHVAGRVHGHGEGGAPARTGIVAVFTPMTSPLVLTSGPAPSCPGECGVGLDDGVNHPPVLRAQ